MPPLKKTKKGITSGLQAARYGLDAVLNAPKIPWKWVLLGSLTVSLLSGYKVWQEKKGK